MRFNILGRLPGCANDRDQISSRLQSKVTNRFVNINDMIFLLILKQSFTKMYIYIFKSILIYKYIAQFNLKQNYKNAVIISKAIRDWRIFSISFSKVFKINK